MASSKRIQLGFFLTMLLLLGSSPGCSVFPSAADQLAQYAQPSPSAPEAAAVEKKITLEVRPLSGRSRTVEVPLAEVPHVQLAYERSRELKKFRRTELEIYRPTANGSRLRMPSRVNPKTKQVTSETDYAIHPGDYIVVNEIPHTLWDDMMEQVSGPLKVLKR
jgi:hypothetical protein